MEITHIQEVVKDVVGQKALMEGIMTELGREFREKDYDVLVEKTSKSGIVLRGIRLSDEYIKTKGYNISPYSGRRGRVLGWHNWVEVNNLVNKVLDALGVSANVKTLHGKFMIREGVRKFTEADWEAHANDNVGSVMRPIARKDAWGCENAELLRKAQDIG